MGLFTQSNFTLMMKLYLTNSSLLYKVWKHAASPCWDCSLYVRSHHTPDIRFDIVLPPLAEIGFHSLFIKSVLVEFYLFAKMDVYYQVWNCAASPSRDCVLFHAHLVLCWGHLMPLQFYVGVILCRHPFLWDLHVWCFIFNFKVDQLR